MAANSVQPDDLSFLLRKEHIIATVTSEQLVKNPEQVEHNYSVHSKTHIPLGDTDKHVAMISKWVGGGNQGAFIGGVTGDYGEGKTSFLIHVWEQVASAGIVAPPPFSWRSIADMVDGVHGWVTYQLKETHPAQVRAADELWDSYREKSLEEMAIKVARETAQDIDVVRRVLAQANADLSVTPEQFLDYCAELSEIVEQAGYKGLLVLLDEPEVAARGRGMSTNEVAQILFDLANGLLSRQGNYGVFVSVPENFMAMVRASFSSLEPRLQGRRCFVSLGNFYNNDFASTLWARYGDALCFAPIKDEIIAPITLEAIGQLTSSSRRDLSFGPRTVITAFRRAVELYQQGCVAYTPHQLVKDALDQEVATRDTYERAVLEGLHALEATEIGEEALLTLAAFPDGVQRSKWAELGLNEDHVLEHAGPGHPVLYQRGGYVGLNSLKKQQDGQAQQNLVEQYIQQFAQEYTPSPSTFEKALDAFDKEVLPLLFKSQQGQSLVGWRREGAEIVGSGLSLVRYCGAFDQTQGYPFRDIHVALSDTTVSSERLIKRYSRGEEPDILTHLRLHWRSDGDLPEWRVDIEEGDPNESEAGLINLAIDLTSSRIEHQQLAQYLGDTDSLTPLLALFVLGEMGRLSLPRQDAALWQAMKQQLMPRLLNALFGDGQPQLREQASKLIEATIPGSPADLLPTLVRYVLTQRFPKYHTLITQPGWKGKVQTYANAVSNQTVPLAARRGQETWSAPSDAVARVFNISRMNLESWATGLETLLEVAKEGDSYEVTFKLHPLEKHIQDSIMSGEVEKRIKIDGKECWWIPLEEIGRFLLTSGYSEEELSALVDIGGRRGTFSQKQHKGRPILYCLPFDPEQMRLKLMENLNGLKTQVDVFRQIPNYGGGPDFAKIEKQIEKVDDEVGFDRIQNQLSGLFERDNDSVSHYAEQLDSTLQSHASVVRQLYGELKGPEYRDLANPAAFKSSWGSDFNRYITSNLQKSARDCEQSANDVLMAIDQLVTNHVKNRSGSPTERATRIAQGWRNLQEQIVKKDEVNTRVRTLGLHVKDYEKWRNLLLSRSDVLYQHLLADQQDEAHQVKAKQFLSELESIWHDISGHLQLRGLSGLGSYAQFEERFKAMESQREGYLRDLKADFDNSKTHVNKMLEDLTSPEKCREVFNPSDLQGCYSRLYEEASGILRRFLESEREACAGAARELSYASKVLAGLPHEEADPLIVELETLDATLLEVEEQVGPKWVQEVKAEGGTLEALRKGILDASQKARQARQLVRQPKFDDESLGNLEGDMLEIVDGPQDLKAIILTLIDLGREPEEILDASLSSLTELFRRGLVNITVEQRKR